MNKFTFSYPTKVYFGEGAAADALKQFFQDHSDYRGTPA